jgi:hypothetical protein
MNTVLSDSSTPWTVNLEERTLALEIVLLRRTYVLPWSQFLYAEGGEDEVRIVFAAHDIMVRGSGLAALLADVAAQRMAVLREPTRAERFSGSGGRMIREIIVQKTEQDEAYG